MSPARFALLGVMVLALVPSIASAQTTVQGQIIIQEAPPSTTVAPAPQAQVYAQPVMVAASPPPQVQTQPQCPVGSVTQVDRFGRMGCYVETTRHGISGGLLGGGIGLLAGGWVASGFSGLVVVTFGAVGCAFASGCTWIANGNASAFLDWGWVPILGPWVQMGYTWPNADPGIFAWLAVEGLIQAGGLVMLIFGALGEDRVVMEPAPGYAITVQPMLSASAQGLSAQLTF